MSEHATREELQQAFLTHRRQHGQQATLTLVKQLTGVEDLDAVPETAREELIGVLNEGASIPRPPTALDPVAIYAKWNSCPRAPGGDHE